MHIKNRMNINLVNTNAKMISLDKGLDMIDYEAVYYTFQDPLSYFQIKQRRKKC